MARDATRNGYASCDCRDCFEIAIASKGEEVVLCWECKKAGCEVCMEEGCEPHDSCRGFECCVERMEEEEEEEEEVS